MESLGNFTAGLQEMLLQSHDGAIRVFPAIPGQWDGAYTLLAEGGFLVTSRREPHRRPEYVELFSSRGGRCTVVNPWVDHLKVLASGGEDDINSTAFIQEVAVEPGHHGGDQTVSFETETGRAYLLLPNGASPPEPNPYSGKQNEEPKKFLEAMLGKASQW